MYKLLLIRKYLLKRRIAWVSLVAVMLCTAMVLVVISVMGGWLRMFRDSFHGLTGDVIVHGQSLTGFPHYEEMIERIEGLPEVKAAVPTIESFGLININNAARQGVQVVGYPFDRIGQVNGFPESVYTYRNHLLDKADEIDWEMKTTKRPLSTESRDDLKQQAESYRKEARELPDKKPWEKLLPNDYYKAMFPNARDDVSKWPNMIIGIGVWDGKKNPDTGKIERPNILFESWAKLTTLAISPDTSNIDVAGDIQPRNYWIVGDSKTNLYQVDEGNVYVPLEQLQSDLKMNAREYKDDDGQMRMSPARVTTVQVSLKPGVDPIVGRDKVREIVQRVQAERGIDVVYPIVVQTWDESQARFLGAVEKEKSLVTFLFGMISIVAVFLIFCIFYMIVVEKTKDIGIVKSVGATSSGVAGIFLGYGLAIGIVGGLMGMVLGYLIVHNINELHTAMGKFLGIQIWTAETYAFDTIPNTMNPNEVAVIVAVAVLASVLGAVVPAIRAARMNPVEALRFE